MKKKEFISRYGKAAYEKRLAQTMEWSRDHPKEVRAQKAKWYKEHLEEKKAQSAEASRKGGKRYDKKLIYEHTGLRGERNKVRSKHRTMWRKYKNIIAPRAILHHQWLLGTAKYAGVALVEKDQHMHGYINVIEISCPDSFLNNEGCL